MSCPGEEFVGAPGCCRYPFYFAHLVGGAVILECAHSGTFWKRLQGGALERVCLYEIRPPAQQASTQKGLLEIAIA